MPGQVTIAALHLVDPNKRIISTADVPPQQQAWHDHASGLAGLFSGNVKEAIDELRDFPVSVEDAEKL